MLGLRAPSPVRRTLLPAGLAAAALLLAGAQEAPRSILPEGIFGPAQRPAEAPSAEPGPEPASEAEPGAVPVLPPGPAGPGRAAAPAQTPGIGPPAAGLPPGAAPGAMPPAAALPQPPSALDAPVEVADLSVTGVLPASAGGMGANAFAGANPAFLMTLMARLDAPVASRWAHITLRRAVASRLPAPPGIRPADWIAARARLLTRMGEGDVAHALVAPVAIDAFTPALYGAAADAMLAAGDIPGLCPLAATGEALTRQDFWRIAAALCMGLEGDELAAANRFDQLRRDRPALAFDIAMAERAASVAGGGRSANLEWEEATGALTLYRIGMAGATASPIPERFLRSLTPREMGWIFRQPGAPDPLRLAAASPAAAQGIVGAAELVAFHAALADSPDAAGVGAEAIARLRLAYTGSSAQRREALAALWAEPDPARRYANLLLTAPLAAGMAPAEALADLAPEAMASALAGGRADRALAWWRIAETGDEATAARSWALAAVADTAGAVPVAPDRFDAWRDADLARGARKAHRERLLLAALDGLGRLEGGGWDALRERHPAGPAATRWSARLAAAAAARRPGEVALIAARSEERRVGKECRSRWSPYH